MTNSISTRPAFKEAHPELQAKHRAIQCGMFAAANAAGLSKDKDLMIDGINAALNFRGSQRLISRTQLTPIEMEAITIAIEAGLFGDDWTWCNDFFISVETHVVEAEIVHFNLCHRKSGAQTSAGIRLSVPSVGDNDNARFRRLIG